MTRIAFLGSHPLGEECLRRLDDHPDVEVPVVVTYPEDDENWCEGSDHTVNCTSNSQLTDQYVLQ